MERALLIIDAQMVYFPGGALPVTHPANSLANILAAMDGAKAAGLPVCVVQHSAAPEPPSPFAPHTPQWELHPEVAARPRDMLLTKHYPGSFTGTELAFWLKEHGADTVTITGYMTQMCCDTTSRQAFHRGIKVEFLSDATGTLDFTNQAGSVTAEELHRAVLVTQAWRFAQVMTTREWLKRIHEENN